MYQTPRAAVLTWALLLAVTGPGAKSYHSESEGLGREIRPRPTQLFGVLFLMCLLFLGRISPLRAQVGNLGALVGTVKDTSGALVPGATIEVNDEATKFISNPHQLRRDRTSLIATLYEIYFRHLAPQKAWERMREFGFKDSWTLHGLKSYLKKHPNSPLVPGDNCESRTTLKRGEGR